MLDREGLLEEYSELYDPASTNGEAMERLAKIIKILRALCPWDKVQTHESLRRCMIEEAYAAGFVSGEEKRTASNPFFSDDCSQTPTSRRSFRRP